MMSDGLDEVASARGRMLLVYIDVVDLSLRSVIRKYENNEVIQNGLACQLKDDLRWNSLRRAPQIWIWKSH